MEHFQLVDGSAGRLRVRGAPAGHTLAIQAPRRVHTASISATATIALPASGAPPVALLAQQVQHGLVVAAAAARAFLTPLPAAQRRRRVQPAAAGAAAKAGSPPTAQQRVRAAQQFLAGGVAGAVSKTLVAPMERISTLLMTPTAGHRYTLRGAVRHAYRDGGVAGLYRGHAATLAKIAPASAIQFSVYHAVARCIVRARQARQPRRPGAQQQQQQQQQQLGDASASLAVHERLAAGAAAGAASACVCYPLESVRTAMSVAGGVRGGLAQAARSVVAAHGVRALYRGFRASLLGDVLGNALGFTAYELGNRLYREHSGGAPAPPHVRGLIGAASAACVLTLTMPLEVVRRRLQVQGLAGRPVLYRGTLHCLASILRTEGLAGFYAASVPSYLKVAPSIGCMYFVFELCMSLSQPPPPAAPAGAGAAAGVASQ